MYIKFKKRKEGGVEKSELLKWATSQHEDQPVTVYIEEEVGGGK